VAVEAGKARARKKENKWLARLAAEADMDMDMVK
jgi:hypothetical protein